MEDNIEKINKNTVNEKEDEKDQPDLVKKEIEQSSKINNDIEKIQNKNDGIKKDTPIKETLRISETKPKKEIPIEKKPFKEFINDHLLPTLIYEFKERGLEVEDINLENTSRPIAGDKCWVVYCNLKNTCNFWISFEKDDISSPKSISLSKSNQKPSIIESFLIDEKRITLKLIISRVLQRLNGQKLIGVN